MQIEGFTPYSALIGGSLIGLAAAVLLLMNGKLMGASGILKNTLLKPRQSVWCFVFILSMFVIAWLVQKITYPSEFIPDLNMSYSRVVLFSFLVGLGASIGSGCTSGHGICGLPRLSKRSFLAVGVFMLSAFVTANLIGAFNG